MNFKATGYVWWIIYLLSAKAQYLEMQFLHYFSQFSNPFHFTFQNDISASLKCRTCSLAIGNK